MEGELRIPITVSARRFGYLIWNGHHDDQIRKYLQKYDTVMLTFKNADFGEKSIDWKYHRISIGYRWTRALPAESKVYVLRFGRANHLTVDVE